MIVGCPGFDRQMLHLATHLSHDLNMKSLLSVVLQALFTSLTDTDEYAESDEGLMAATVLRYELKKNLAILVEESAGVL